MPHFVKVSQESPSSQVPVLIIEFRKIDEFMKVSWEWDVWSGVFRNASFYESPHKKQLPLASFLDYRI